VDETPRFQDTQHLKFVRLSVLCIGRLYPQGNIPGTHSSWWLGRPQEHSVAGKNMSKKNSRDTIENQTRDLPACRAVPQYTTPPRSPQTRGDVTILHILVFTFIGPRGNRRFPYLICSSFLHTNNSVSLVSLRSISDSLHFQRICLSVSSEITECNRSLPRCGF
jgi:hypothetical protein